MGLDMYLYKRINLDVYDFNKKNYKSKKTTIKIKNQFTSRDATHKTIEIDSPEFDGYVMMPVKYWRKANAIHRWFVELSGREDDCSNIFLYGKDLRDLTDRCKQVLDDHDKAKDLLPTQDGFFFGGTEYDEYYFSYIKDTYEALKDVEIDETFIYSSSW